MGDFDFTTTGFKVEGFAELYRNLDKLERIQKATALEPMLIEALTPMSLVAQTLAPDDPITGPPWDLRASVSVSGRQRAGRARSDRALGQYGARAYMGPTKFGYPEAMFAEFGTTQRHWKTGKSTGYEAPHPYMRPAWDSGKEGALEIIKQRFSTYVFNAARSFSVSPVGSR